MADDNLEDAMGVGCVLGGICFLAFGLLGFGVGLIFFSFLQAVGVSCVASVVGGGLAAWIGYSCGKRAR